MSKTFNRDKIKDSFIDKASVSAEDDASTNPSDKNTSIGISDNWLVCYYCKKFPDKYPVRCQKCVNYFFCRSCFPDKAPCPGCKQSKFCKLILYETCFLRAEFKSCDDTLLPNDPNIEKNKKEEYEHEKECKYQKYVYASIEKQETNLCQHKKINQNKELDRKPKKGEENERRSVETKMPDQKMGDIEKLIVSLQEKILKILDFYGEELVKYEIIIDKDDLLWSEVTKKLNIQFKDHRNSLNKQTNMFDKTSKVPHKQQSLEKKIVESYESQIENLKERLLYKEREIKELKKAISNLTEKNEKKKVTQQAKKQSVVSEMGLEEKYNNPIFDQEITIETNVSSVRKINQEKR